MINPPIFITGASGFLASHIILKLLALGYTVRGSVRSATRGDQIRKVLEKQGADTSGLSFVLLDLMSDDGWTTAMDGMGILIHTASPFITYIPTDEDEVIRPAVEGTRRALKAALRSGVERIILTSSEVAVAHGHSKSRKEVFTETDWSNLDASDITPYMKSKTLAEREAWAIMKDAGRVTDLTTINPGFILGPLLEQDIGTSGAIIKKMMSGKFPGAPDLWLSIVDVRDVADLHIASMRDSHAFGHRVLASNVSVSFCQIAKMVADTFPEHARALPTRKLPDFAIRLVGLFDEDARASVRLLGRRFDLEHERAEKILGHSLIGSEEAVVATACSLIEMGLV